MSEIDRVPTLEAAVSDALAASSEGTVYTEAPEPSDEPGSPYVLRLANELRARGVTLATPDRAEAERARYAPLRDAARAVLTELDIIRRQWDTSKFAYPIVHIDTHEDLRAVLAAIDAPGTAPDRADLRAVLLEIADDSPNWMVPDAVLEHAQRMQRIARAALASTSTGTAPLDPSPTESATPDRAQPE